MLNDRGLNRRDIVWILIALGLSAAQVAATIADRNVWPISAYNVFNFKPGQKFVDFEIGLTNKAGRQMLVHPGRTMPLDFFRANAIVRDRFVLRPDPITQARLSRLMIQRLNGDAWYGWDERFAPARSDEPFRRLEVFAVLHETDSMRNVQRTSLYVYTSMR
ncbi:MAG: hypothetical protein AAF385_12490 [Pseudomonadota bacterium]